MRFLLDTHFVLAFLRKEFATQFPAYDHLFATGGDQGFISVASLWEIAIKSRLGKLDPDVPLADMAAILTDGGLAILAIRTAHVIASVDPQPETRDPFDRLLLAQCQVEGLQLVTIDRALVDHPLAFRF